MLGNYVKQFGSLCCYSAMSILLILPHAMCWIILEVDQKFSENKIVKFFQQKRVYAGYIKVVKTVMSMSDKYTVYYMALTGQPYWESQRMSRVLLECNKNLFTLISHTSLIVTLICRLVSALVGIGIMSAFKSPQLSPLLTCLILGISFSGLVMNVIHYTNMCIVYAYNFDVLTGIGQDQQAMPRDMNELLHNYGKQEEQEKKRKKLEEEIEEERRQELINRTAL